MAQMVTQLLAIGDGNPRIDPLLVDWSPQNIQAPARLVEVDMAITRWLWLT